MVVLIYPQSQNVVWPTKFLTSNLILMAGPSLLKDWRSLCLSVPIWTTEGSACPPLMSLWNPSRGPLFSADHSPSHTHSQRPLFQTHPSSCSPIYSPWPWPASSQHRPPDGLLRPFPDKRLPMWSSLHWGRRAGGCGLDLGLAKGSLGWGEGQCSCFLLNSKWFFIVSESWEGAGSPGGSDGKESACNAGNLDSILGSGRYPGEGNVYPLQYSCLGNPMDRGAWLATVHGVAKSWTGLSD